MSRPTNVVTRRLSESQRAALDNAVASTHLEGANIPAEHQDLAAAYLAGDIDDATYQAKARALTAKDLGIDL